MNPKQMKKPGSGGNRYPGQQRNLGKPAAPWNRTTKPAYKFQTASILPSAEDFYAQEIEMFDTGRNGWALGCCPFHDDRSPSFAMNLDTGAYFCRSTTCGAKGGSLVGFVIELHGLTPREAYRYLEEWA